MDCMATVGPLSGRVLTRDDIPEYIRVDDEGRIWRSRLRSDGPTVPERRAETRTTDDYLWVYFNGKYHRAHRVVIAWMYGEAPAGLLIRHLNGDKRDNRPENLAVGSAAENTQDAVMHGTLPRGSKHGNARLSESQVLEMRSRHQSGESYDRLASAFMVSKSTVAWIIRGQYWRHVTMADPNEVTLEIQDLQVGIGSEPVQEEPETEQE